MRQDPFLFKAVVTRVNLTDSSSISTSGPVAVSDAQLSPVIKGTIDCVAEIPRLSLRNVRMLVPNASTSLYSALGAGPTLPYPGGFWHMPNVSDIVVCAFLNGYPDYAVCVGSLFAAGNPATAVPAANGSPVPSNGATVSSDGPGFQRQDAIWMHESGAYLRFRNLNVNPATQTILAGAPLRPQITLFHSPGTEFNIIQNQDGTITSSFIAKSGNYTNTDGVGNVDTQINGQWTVQAANSIIWRCLNTLANISMTTDGSITMMDGNTNLIRMDSNGILVQDLVNNNFLTMNSSGITLLDTNGNTVVMDSIGISMRAPGNNINLVGDNSVNLISPIITLGTSSPPYDLAATAGPLVTLLNLILAHSHTVNVITPGTLVGEVISGPGAGGAVAITGVTDPSPTLTPFSPVLNTQIGSGAVSVQAAPVPLT